MAQDKEKSDVKTLIAHLGEGRMMTKWRDGVLLVSYPSWLRTAAEFEPLKAPWEPLKAFRDAVLKDPEEGPTLPLLCHLAAQLTPGQALAIDDLGASPLAYSQTSLFLFRAIAELHPLLAELDRRPELMASLLKPQGMGVREPCRASFRSMSSRFWTIPCR